jgi:hypothetical protein
MARSERSASTRRFVILYLITLGSGLGRRRKSGPLVSRQQNPRLRFCIHNCVYLKLTA